MVICLERDANDLHMIQLVPLPPQSHHVFALLNPDWCTFLMQAFPVGCPGKEAIKRLCLSNFERVGVFHAYCYKIF